MRPFCLTNIVLDGSLGYPAQNVSFAKGWWESFFFRYPWPQWQKYFWWRNALLPPKSRHVKIQHAILCPVTRVRHQPGGWGGCSFSSGSIRRVTTPCSLTRFSYGLRFVLVSFGFQKLLEMGKKCFVPRCNAEYKTCAEKLAVFATLKKEDRPKVWCHAIPCKDRLL